MFCATKHLRYIFFGFNALCAFIGIGIIWYGIWLLHVDVTTQLDNNEKLIGGVIIMLGVSIFSIATYGYVSGYLESNIMLIGYAVTLMVLLVIQIVLVTLSYAMASGGLSHGLQRGFEELWDKEHKNVNGTLAYYEQWLECCGKYSPNDYFLMDKVPPSSCCKEKDCTNVLNVYVNGCEQKFKEYVRAKTHCFNVVNWFLILVEFTGSILACVLVDSLRNYRDRIRLYN